MPTDGSRQNPGPTVQLREYIERILDEREKAQVATFAAAMREADTKAREMERRLEGLNELRTEVTRDRSRFVERTEHELLQTAMDRRVAAIERWNAKVVGVGLVLIVLVGVLSTLVGTWIK